MVSCISLMYYSVGSTYTCFNLGSARSWLLAIVAAALKLNRHQLGCIQETNGKQCIVADISDFSLVSCCSAAFLKAPAPGSMWLPENLSFHMLFKKQVSNSHDWGEKPENVSLCSRFHSEASSCSRQAVAWQSLNCEAGFHSEASPSIPWCPSVLLDRLGGWRKGKGWRPRPSLSPLVPAQSPKGRGVECLSCLFIRQSSSVSYLFVLSLACDMVAAHFPPVGVPSKSQQLS